MYISFPINLIFCGKSKVPIGYFELERGNYVENFLSFLETSTQEKIMGVIHKYQGQRVNGIIYWNRSSLERFADA